jgi:glycosyltransferase involved in cell wall biosynthesis
MADAAIAYGANGREVYFVTVEPKTPFFSAGKAETMVELLAPHKEVVKTVSAAVTGEFELGLPEYRIGIYCRLMQEHLPVGTVVIVSDNPDVWAAAAAMKAAFPLVGVLHADEAHYFRLAAKYAADFDFYACVSNRIAQKLAVDVPNWPATRTAVIPCGIKLPKFVGPRAVADAVKLVYVGRLTEYQKRISDLLKVALNLRESGFKFTLTIVGDGGADKMKLQEAVSAAGMDGCVTFAGWLAKDRVADVLATSDIMVMTSDFEGTPVAMMEALAAGCGFVGTRVSGIEDYESVSGSTVCFRIFEVGAPEEAAAKIKELAHYPPMERALAARQIAETYFAMATCLNRYNEAFTAVVRSCSPVDAPRTSPLALMKSRLLYMLRAAKLRRAHKPAA